ncbi:succinylglutamate desuccinylase/aspartoacylase family protein [Streptomyces sp. NBC_01477]|uniref:succinylglutamate desuccinylase/aspartoacylase family protein n=1 Tax=Streptomyces sp. NBC_01477 TaxID=2976015 RepID=UPI002E34D859|nr:M14 family metallopeptidase [Streptomyces sp. NBC_01477]
MSDTATTTRPGRTVETVPVTRLGNGHDLELTVHRVVGTRPGKTLVAFGGIHGDEAMGPEEVRRLVTSVDPAELSGTIIAVPVANPYAYDAMSRFTPHDGLNLNRIFPGDRKGSVTEQLAAVLAEIITGADHFIDFHSSGLYSTVEYAYVMDDGRDMATGFGSPLLYHHAPYEGSSNAWAITNGISSTVCELGGGGQLTDAFLDKAVSRGRNMLKAIGMLDGEPEPPAAPQKVLTELVILRPTQGGAIISDYAPDRLGEVVKGGTVLGRVVDPYTFEVIEELVAPFESSVLVLTREGYTRTTPGDYGFMVGNADTTLTVEELFDR